MTEQTKPKSKDDKKGKRKKRKLPLIDWHKVVYGKAER